MERKLVIVLICTAFLIADQINGDPSISADDGPIVETTTGAVRGVVADAEGRTYNRFLSIPFAKPPVGDLRFAAPVVADPWDDIYNATADKPFCIQWNPISFGASGEEDCLYLNVYTPLIPTGDDALLPVNVFIYGGAYIWGSVIGYGPERFMQYDMVLVLMNYRLGSFGFLSTQDDAASGNFGLLDQQLALRWVQDNIAAFGGDKTRVTLSGESAGSVNAIHHVLAPSSAGLFHQVIAESGSALCPWGEYEAPLQAAKDLGRRFDCPTDDTAGLVACLRQQSASYITQSEITVMIEALQLTYVPVVENPTSGVFLTESPMTLLQEGRFNKVPILMGFNRDEGGLLYIFTYMMMNTIDNYFFDVAVPNLLSVFTDYRTNLVNISYAIKDEYYSKIDVNNHTQVVRTNLDLISDMFMKPWIAQTIQLISAQDVPVYMYDFEYVSDTSYTHFTGEPDVDHAAELKFLFKLPIPLSVKDTPFQKKFIDLWANFIINGNPTPAGSEVAWTPTPAGGTAHLMIDEMFMMMDEYYPERITFWEVTVPTIANA